MNLPGDLAHRLDSLRHMMELPDAIANTTARAAAKVDCVWVLAQISGVWEGSKTVGLIGALARLYAC